MLNAPIIRMALLTALVVPMMGAKRDRSEKVKADPAPLWVSHPDKVKLEIVEQLVLEKKQYDSAAGIIAQLRRDGNTEPLLDLLQGITFREQGILGESERLLLNARKHMPGDARVHGAICILYSDAMRLDEAIGSCEKAVRVDDTDAVTWNNLGFLYLATERYPEAVEAIQTAVDQDGATPRYMNNLALATVATGDPNMALNMLLANGNMVNATYDVAIAVERFNGTDRALEWYSRVLTIDPTHTLAQDATARIQSTSPEFSQETDE
ncbi:MAG: hypothetical protein GWP91_25550 [Rhodobacterales bacterium]|nr:hypothetical protein [Rhodobacterales bacterium]